MLNTHSKTRTQEAGEATEFLFSFHRSFTPELMLMARISSQCNINPAFRDVFTLEDMELVALLLEHFKSLTVIFARYRVSDQLTPEEMAHAREIMGRQ